MVLVGHQKKKKKISNLSVRSEKTEISEEEKLGTIKEASKDSVRAIMLIRAYRIRGIL